MVDPDWMPGQKSPNTEVLKARLIVKKRKDCAIMTGLKNHRRNNDKRESDLETVGDDIDSCIVIILWYYQRNNNKREKKYEIGNRDVDVKLIMIFMTLMISMILMMILPARQLQVRKERWDRRHKGRRGGGEIQKPLTWKSLYHFYQNQVRSLPCLVTESVRHCLLFVNFVQIGFVKVVRWICQNLWMYYAARKTFPRPPVATNINSLVWAMMKMMMIFWLR